MAYACPVCDEPQIDSAHLANHVAFTAITGDDAHEEWLDANVEEWGQLGEAELGEIVVEHAEETEFPVDMDATEASAAGHDHSHGHDHGHQHSHGAGQGSGRGHDTDIPPTSMPTGDLDDDAEDVLAEARELTRQMADDGGASETPEAEEDADGEEED